VGIPRNWPEKLLDNIRTVGRMHGVFMNDPVKQQWLIPFLPLVAAAVQSLLPRGARKLSAGICL